MSLFPKKWSIPLIPKRWILTMDRLHIIYNAPFSFTSLLNWPFATAAFKAVDHVLAETANRVGASMVVIHVIQPSTCFFCIKYRQTEQAKIKWVEVRSLPRDICKHCPSILHHSQSAYAYWKLCKDLRKL